MRWDQLGDGKMKKPHSMGNSEMVQPIPEAKRANGRRLSATQQEAPALAHALTFAANCGIAHRVVKPGAGSRRTLCLRKGTAEKGWPTGIGNIDLRCATSQATSARNRQSLHLQVFFVGILGGWGCHDASSTECNFHVR